jgi:predicted ester cyclase
MLVTRPPAGGSRTELIRWVFDVLNAHDTAPLHGVYTDATTERFPNRMCNGEPEIRRYFEDLFAAMPDTHWRLLRIAEDGDDVFVHWILTGRHTGAPFDGIEATGRAVAVDGIDHFVVRDGTVVSNFVVFDQMQMARQVGLIPEDRSLADRVLKGAFGVKTRLVRRLPGR